MTTNHIVAESTFDAQLFRRSLGNYASGVTVITAKNKGDLIGFTCQSFFSLSVEPPLVAFSVMETSTSYPKLRASSSFAINILAEDQQDLSNQFARSGTDKWAGVKWSLSQLGAPVLDGSVLTLDCTLYREYEGGDHTLVVAHVEDIKVNGTVDPLLFFRGQYEEIRKTDNSQ